MLIEVKRKTNNKPDRHLTNNFKSASQPFLIFFKHFNIVIQKPDGAKPNRCSDQQDHINVVEFGHQQSGDKNGSNDDQSSHRWCAFFLKLPFKTQITDILTHLLSS